MKEAYEIVRLLVENGVPIALIIALFVLGAIIIDPTRADSLKALFLKPFFRFFRWCSKEYLASEIGGTITGFLRNYIDPSLLSVSAPRIKIRWVTSLSDPILLKDNTLILCLEDNNDQTKNILLATQVALPHIVCPMLRSQVSEHVGKAIDLVLLQKLADGMGRHAAPLFQRYFLNPEVENELQIASLFSKLKEIDSQGIFVFIFLEELSQFSERLYRDADFSDKTSEIEKLLEFLLTIARRGHGEETELSYQSIEFKINIILVAKKAKAKTQGISPYLKAVDFSIDHGYDSIYLIGYLHSSRTFKSTINALHSDNRVAVEKQSRTRISPDMKEAYLSNYVLLAFLRVISYMSDSTFKERVDTAGLQEGMQLEGIILDVMQDRCVLDVRGIHCSLRRAEASWNYLPSCTDIMMANETISVLIKNINFENGEIEVSRHLPEEDPWKQILPPEPNDTIEVTLTKRAGKNFYGLYKKLVEIIIPESEISWLHKDSIQDEDFIGSTVNVHVLEKDDQKHNILASIRLLDTNPWPEIQKRYPKNTALSGVVCEVNHEHVIVSLEDGLIGHIPRESMLKAGFEFTEYEKNVVPGQGLDVVVTKVFSVKKKIRLDLKRNKVTNLE